MIGLLVWQPWVTNPTTKVVEASKPPHPPKPIACFADEPPQGVYEDKSRSPHVGQFTIRTARGADYFVKLEDAATSYTAMTFYIRGASSITESVPLGNFILKYASGRPWCGEDELFGSDTILKQADDTFLFARTPTPSGYSISHWTVELIRQKGGNLSTHSISRDEF
jgi:hypothetical protein